MQGALCCIILLFCESASAWHLSARSWALALPAGRGYALPSLTKPLALRVPSPPLARAPDPADDPVDAKLLAADVTLIFAFSFARTLSNILISPTFEGWLAPIRADPQRLATTLTFAASLSLTWVAIGVAFGNFSPGVDVESTRRVGPAATARGFAAVAAAWFALASCVAAGGVNAPALALTPANLQALVGVGILLVAWRSVVADITLR
jgi:hypothetical protein